MKTKLPLWRSNNQILGNLLIYRNRKIPHISVVHKNISKYVLWYDKTSQKTTSQNLTEDRTEDLTINNRSDNLAISNFFNTALLILHTSKVYKTISMKYNLL